MSDILVRIKRAILAGNFTFSKKASLELEEDDLSELDVVESILNAVRSISESVLQVRFEGRSANIYTSFKAPIWPVCPFTRRENLSLRAVSRHTTFWFLRRGPSRPFSELV